MTTTLQLLGPPTLHVDAEARRMPHTRPALLLLYLAANGGWVGRERLTYLLRPDSPEGAARHYLRNLLNRAKQVPHVAGLEAEARSCRWPVDTDRRRFGLAFEEGRWFEATQLYKGPFLQGIEVEDLPHFQSWLDEQRDLLHRAWRHAALAYAADQESSGRHVSAGVTLKGLLDEDSLDEEALQALVRNTYLAGDRDAALHFADAFVRELRQDLELEPLPATEHLIETVRRDEPIEPVRTKRRHGRRWTDRIERAQNDVSDLVALLQQPSTTLLGVHDDDADAERIVLSTPVPGGRIANLALLEAAEALVAREAFLRARTLVGLLESRGAAEEPSLRPRMEALAATLSEQRIPSGGGARTGPAM